jgi:GNAT superfamily N-acetyltransferase
VESDGIDVRRLTGGAARGAVGGLADVLHDCVSGGASVSFMAPFERDEAVAFFESVLPEVDAGTRVLLAAFDGDAVVGTVQLIHAWPPNQPHRADITKLLVHRDARGRGVGRRLMERAEDEARADGKTVLVLDTVTDSDAYRLYERLGWTKVGPVPDYALYPDGRLCETTFFYKRV